MDTAKSILSQPIETDPKYSNNRAAQYIGVRPQTLAVWRSTGRYGIPYLKVGRKVFYRKSVLDAWLKSRTATHTGQEFQAAEV